MPILTDHQKELLAAECGRARNRSDAYYRSTSGADKIAGERYRLVAQAWTKLWQGRGLAEVIAWIETEWRKFAAEMRAKVAAAPKIKTGPSAGISCIHYKHAGDSEIDANVISLRSVYRQIMDSPCQSQSA